jgi:hypothetical protein
MQSIVHAKLSISLSTGERCGPSPVSITFPAISSGRRNSIGKHVTAESYAILHGPLPAHPVDHNVTSERRPRIGAAGAASNRSVHRLTRRSTKIPVPSESLTSIESSQRQ